MTMTPECEQARLTGMALTDGEAGPLSREALAAHLAACAECRRAVDEAQALRAAFAPMALAHPEPPGTWEELRPKLIARRAPRRGWLIAGAGAVVGVRLALLVGDPGLGWSVQLAPLVIAVLLLGALRVNPLRVDAVIDTAA